MTIQSNSVSRSQLLLKVVLGVLLFCTTSLFAQKKSAFKEGYVLPLNGDTLRGLVMDRDESAFGGLLTKVKFRSDKGRRRKYKPSDLLGYHRGADSFVSLWINTETKYFAQHYSSVVGLGEQYFVKVIYHGSLDLYHWEYTDEDNNTIDFLPLIRKANSAELVRVTQGILGLKRKRLAEYFADCPNLASAIKSKTLHSSAELIDYYELNCAQ